MPKGAKALNLCFLMGLAFFLEIWNKCTFGQVAYETGSYHFGKFLIGGFLFMGASSSSPLLTAHRDQLLFHDHQGQPDTAF